MEKRQFLKLTALVGTGTALLSATPFSAAQPAEEEKFTLPDLDYAYDALVPYIDAETMRIHHSKHFQSYTDKLNAAISGTTYADLSINDILKNIEASDTAIRNNGGGYYNHRLFFESLSPSAKPAPEGNLKKAIKKAFGSVESFQKQFSQAAGGVFGSGWAWLTASEQGQLSITTTPNQDNPLMPFVNERGYPLMGIDVWEHAYYLKYHNKRTEYINAFWKVLNWGFVEQRFNKL
ncbi:superoxide dismutase [Fulvivirga sp. 29W222]|uniref:Superoxide dismutase n=1 Tax=Fulvivirga marina TaxID=2494733 RepID=A0A937FWS4_9BACT|nr:superoxide dismutase [Fulvivirga marina]MBL6447595.1 superoxide dismutase [Fulvivirga marina]